MGYAGRHKYDEPGKAAAYRDRSRRRDEEEWGLLQQIVDDLRPAPATAWDVPCGTGRIAERLLALGIATRCGDLSPSMRAETETRLAGQPAYGGVVPFDLEDPGPAALEKADLVVCMRFLHHLPDRAHRQRVWRTLRRLAREHVLVSFHHPISFHNLERGLRRLVGGSRGDRYTLSPAALRAEAAEAGLAVVGFRALAAWRREFWLAHLRPAAPATEPLPDAEVVPQPSV